MIVKYIRCRIVVHYHNENNNGTHVLPHSQDDNFFLILRAGVDMIDGIHSLASTDWPLAETGPRPPCVNVIVLLLLLILMLFPVVIKNPAPLHIFLPGLGFGAIHVVLVSKSG